MSTISFVPKPLSFRDRVSAIWSILRGKRYLVNGTLELFKPYIVQVRFSSGQTVLYQTSSLDRLAGQAADAANLDVMDADYIRVIRRSDLAVLTEVITDVSV